MKQNNLKNKTFLGLVWSFTDLIGNQGIQFIIQIILSRILIPEHFGLIGMIFVVIAISNSIIDSGFSQALIREKNVSQLDYSTVFYFNVAISILIYTSIFFSAQSISDFYAQPELISILKVLSLGIIFNSFSIIPRVMYTKELNFKIQMKINMSASVVSGVIAVAFAFSGIGVWSLVLQTLIMNFLQTFLLSFTRKWVPSLAFSVESFKRLFGFGWKLLISGLMDTLFQNIFILIIGRQYSTSQLGFYTNASKLRDMASHTLTSTLQRVTYPVLSNIHDDNGSLKHSYKRIIKLAGFIIFPLMTGLAAIGEPVVNILFGQKWLPMVNYFQLLCFAGMLYPIHALNLNILKVKGRSDLFLYLEIVKKASLSIFILLAVTLKLGVIGLIGAAVINSYISLLINTYYSGKEINYSFKEQFNDLLPIFINSIIMGVIVYITGVVLLLNSIVILILQIFIGFFFYIVLCKIAKIGELKTVIELLAPFIRKIKLLYIAKGRAS
jgi:O-antigen/teichoic acid export membrane protein